MIFSSGEFVRIVRTHADCQMLHQDFLRLDLPRAHFEGIFANASLFHVPISQLAPVLGVLTTTVKSVGDLLCSNSRSNNEQAWLDRRYGSFHGVGTWCSFVTESSFEELRHYYRPIGWPQTQQPWLVTVWRRNCDVSLDAVPPHQKYL